MSAGLGQYFRSNSRPSTRAAAGAVYSSEPHPRPQGDHHAPSMRGELFLVPNGAELGKSKKAWIVVQESRLTIYSSSSNLSRNLVDLRYSSITVTFWLRTNGFFVFGVDVIGSARVDRLVLATNEEADFQAWSRFFEYTKVPHHTTGSRQHADHTSSRGGESVSGAPVETVLGDGSPHEHERAFFSDEIQRLTATCHEWQRRANWLRTCAEDALHLPRGDPDDWGLSIDRVCLALQHRFADTHTAAQLGFDTARHLSALAVSSMDATMAKFDSVTQQATTVALSRTTQTEQQLMQANARLALFSSLPAHGVDNPLSNRLLLMERIIDVAVGCKIVDSTEAPLLNESTVQRVCDAIIKGSVTLSGGDATRIALLQDELAQRSQQVEMLRAVVHQSAGSYAAGDGGVSRWRATLLSLRRLSHQSALSCAEDLLRGIIEARDAVLHSQRSFESLALISRQHSDSAVLRDEALRDLDLVKRQRDQLRDAIPALAVVAPEEWSEQWYVHVLQHIANLEARIHAADQERMRALGKMNAESQRALDTHERALREQKKTHSALIEELSRTCRQRDTEIARMKAQFEDLRSHWLVETQTLESIVAALQGRPYDAEAARKLRLAASADVGSVQSIDAIARVLTGSSTTADAAARLERLLLLCTEHLIPHQPPTNALPPLSDLIERAITAAECRQQKDPSEADSDDASVLAYVDHLVALAGLPPPINPAERLQAVCKLCDTYRFAPTVTAAAVGSHRLLAAASSSPPPGEHVIDSDADSEWSATRPDRRALVAALHQKDVHIQHWREELDRSRRDVNILLGRIDAATARTRAYKEAASFALLKSIVGSTGHCAFSRWARFAAQSRRRRAQRRVAASLMQSTSIGRLRCAYRAWSYLLAARKKSRLMRAGAELLMSRTTAGLRSLYLRRWNLFATRANERRSRRGGALKAAYAIVSRGSTAQHRRVMFQAWARFAAQSRRRQSNAALITTAGDVLLSESAERLAIVQQATDGCISAMLCASPPAVLTKLMSTLNVAEPSQAVDVLENMMHSLRLLVQEQYAAASRR